MSYAGQDAQGFTTGSNGFGSFTLNGQGDLTAFTFTLDENTTDNFGNPQMDVFTWGITDLNGTFQAILTGGSVADLSFLTDLQAGYWTPDQMFQVTDLGTDDAVSFDFDTGPITFGTLVVTPGAIPEPTALLVFAAGLAGLAIVRRRRGA